MPIITSVKAETQAEVSSSLTAWSIAMRLSALQSQWSLKIHLYNLLQIVRLLAGCSVFHVALQQTLHTMVSDVPGVGVPSASRFCSIPNPCHIHAGSWTWALPHS